MGHGSPGARRAPAERQWQLVEALEPDVVLAQETRRELLESLNGYDVVFSLRPGTGWGTAVAVRSDFGSLTEQDNFDRPGLLACGRLSYGSGPETFVASVHVPSTQNAQQWLREIAEKAGRGAMLIGGDFNAGPSIGKNPLPLAGELGLRELTTSSPERNTLVRPRHPGTLFQIDHVLGRGWDRTAPMSVLPLADLGGPQLSDHNALWTTLQEDRAGVPQPV